MPTQGPPPTGSRALQEAVCRWTCYRKVCGVRKWRRKGILACRMNSSQRMTGCRTNGTRDEGQSKGRTRTWSIFVPRGGDLILSCTPKPTADTRRRGDIRLRRRNHDSEEIVELFPASFIFCFVPKRRPIKEFRRWQKEI